MNDSIVSPSCEHYATPSVEADGATILLVDISSGDPSELVEQLRADRYRVAVAQTAEHARWLARTRPIRAILLGPATPRGGLELLGEIRRSATEPDPIWDEHLPAIVLGRSARGLELLRAFEEGADDFIGTDRPGEDRSVEGDCFYMELRVRLRALLRRHETPSPSRRLNVGPLTVDTYARLACVAGARIQLSPLEYELLVQLARNPRNVCSKQDLMRAIWNRQACAGTRTVDSHASRLRRKLHAAGAPGLVVNVWGVGYRLI